MVILMIIENFIFKELKTEKGIIRMNNTNTKSQGNDHRY